MRAQWYLIVFFSCSLLLGGCNNDYRFSHVDHVPSDDDDDGPQPPDPPVTPDPPPHNWPPDVGNVPDLYFAIAWSETPCNWNDSLWADGSQPCEPEQQSDVWAFCDGRNVAVVNMFGEVVDEFTPPGLEDGEAVQFIQLSGGGPGQFLHVVHPLGDVDSGAPSDASASTTPWQAWRADSYSGEHIKVAEWNSEAQQVWLPQAGRHVDVGAQAAALEVGLMPTQPDLLLTWPGQPWCDPSTPVQPARINHLFSSEVLIPAWPAEQFLPEEILDHVGMSSAWSMNLSVDEEGDLSALFGVTTGGCGGEPNDTATLQLVSWSPDPDAAWFSPTETGWQPKSATYTGKRGTGALNLLGDFGLPRWRVTSPSLVSEGDLSPERGGYRPGPIIDPQGPTFTVIGTDLQTWAGDSLDFYHQGEVVWSIDRLKFGMQERQVYFADVVLLSQRP